MKLSNKMKNVKNIFKSNSTNLSKCDNNTPMFSLEGEMKLCKVVDIYDGDTCKVVFKLKDKLYRWNVRMNGYDSPEMRVSKSNPRRDDIKQKAILARDYLSSLVKNENQLVYIKCGEFDKYGRLLGTLYINKNDNVSVNDMMIKNGHGYNYFGGTKISNV